MLWVTSDEGETYTGHSIAFDPNRIIFQSRRAPGSNSTTLAQYVLGYDSTHNQVGRVDGVHQVGGGWVGGVHQVGGEWVGSIRWVEGGWGSIEMSGVVGGGIHQLSG